LSHLEAKEQFRASLVDLVNQKIAESGISPQAVAEVFVEEAQVALDYMSWKPHPQRAAYEHLIAATACLNDGAVIPVPGFDILFPGKQ
jgi:L-amino acid N-acyltransferase YncA